MIKLKTLSALSLAAITLFPLQLVAKNKTTKGSGVVSLSPYQTKILYSLGINPVGITDINEFKERQTNNLTNLGYTFQPSLTEIIRLHPQVIFATETHSRISKPLRSIATTYIQDISLCKENITKKMRDDFSFIAKRVGRQSQLEKIYYQSNKDIHNSLIKQNNIHSDKPALIVKFIGIGQLIEIYTKHSIAGAALKELGITNAFHENRFVCNERVEMSLSAISKFGDFRLLVVGNLPTKADITHSMTWKSISAVKNSEISLLHSLPENPTFSDLASVTGEVSQALINISKRRAVN